MVPESTHTWISVSYIINRRVLILELYSNRLPEWWYLPQKAKSISDEENDNNERIQLLAVIRLSSPTI